MTKKFLTDNSLVEADAALYGTTQLPIPDNVVATPLSIFDIWPDVVQPRRVVPSLIRGAWDGDPDYVADLLDHWQTLVGSLLEYELKIEPLLNGGGDGLTLPEYPLAADFIKLVSMAASIKADGLTNPITVSQQGDRYQIETGERRWLCFHLLYHHIGTDWQTIPARQVKHDVWRQASENNVRADLNAISRARQLSLLLMDLNRNGDGVRFDAYEALVLPGECDRRFYAQAINLRIPKGLAGRVHTAMNLGSDSQVSQYRALLSISDELWLQADSENWTEGRIREAVAASKPAPVQDSLFAVGERVQVLKHGLGTIRYIKNGRYGVYLDSSQTTHYYGASEVKAIKQSADAEPETPDTFTGVKVSPGQKGSSVADPTASFDRDYWLERKVNLHDMRGGMESGTVSKVVGDSLLVVMDKGGQRMVDMQAAVPFSTAVEDDDNEPLWDPEKEPAPPKMDDVPSVPRYAMALSQEMDLHVWDRLKDIADFMKDDKAKAALVELRSLTALEAHQLEFEVHDLGPQSVLHQRFGKHYDAIDNLLTRFLSRFEDALERIEREARRYGNENKS